MPIALCCRSLRDGVFFGAECRSWWQDDFFWRNFPLRRFFGIAIANGIMFQKRSGGAAYEAYVTGFSGGERVAIFPENVEFSVNFP